MHRKYKLWKILKFLFIICAVENSEEERKTVENKEAVSELQPKKSRIKIFPLLLLILVLTIVGIFTWFGFIPGLSNILGVNKPKNLGIKYTQEDLLAARSKSQISYEVLPAGSTTTSQFSGERQVSKSFTSAEITASLNNQPWVDYPYKNVQVKFNADGSGEISGNIIKDKFPGYMNAIGVPQVATDLAMKFLPPDPAFYVKIKASLTNNQISVFEPQIFQIGKLSVPLNLLLSDGKLASKVYAQDLNGITGELNKVSGKRGLIIDFINQKLSSIGAFYAKSAYFRENELVFDGTLTEKILYTQ